MYIGTTTLILYIRTIIPDDMGIPSPANLAYRDGAMRDSGARIMELTMLVLIGLLVLELLLFWGYVVLVERYNSTTVASGVLGAALVTAIALTLWFIGLTAFFRGD